MAASAFEAFPTSQMTQALLLSLPEYVPLAQSVQELDPLELNFPEAHAEQVAEPLVLLVPARQLTQESAPPVPALYFPGLQLLQVAVFPSEKVPAKQVTQLVEPETLSLL